jgi:O-antigen ligase
VQIAAVAFVVSGLPLLLKHRQKLISLWPIRLLAGFVALNWLSVFWALSNTRVVVLSGYMTFLLILVACITALFIDRKITQKDITNPLILGTIIGAGFGWLQYIGVTSGVGPEFTLIREAYSAELFGFARIQAFSLEPQFYANSLIAAITYLAWLILFGKYNTYHFWLLAWFVATLLMTVSRGGTLGLIMSVGFMVVFLIIKKPKDLWSRIGKLTLTFVLALIMSLTAVYVSATIHPKHDGIRSIEIFVDQMSHGIIDIRLANGGEGVEGLVEASTSGRLYMVERALEITAMSPQNYLIGVGSGSFGPAFQANFKGKISNHVTNNQYAEVLVELGLIGLGLFLAFVISFGKTIWQKTDRYKLLFMGIWLAYLVQYMFFSLQTNVLHIWLFVGVALGVSVLNNKAKP